MLLSNSLYKIYIYEGVIILYKYIGVILDVVILYSYTFTGRIQLNIHTLIKDFLTIICSANIDMSLENNPQKSSCYT